MSLLICLPALRLEGQKNRHPLLARWKPDEECAILKDAVISHKLRDITLVHVHVMYAIARQKTEDLVARTRLWPPTLTEDVNQSIFIGQGLLHDAIQLLIQVVVRSRHIERQRSHQLSVKQIASDEIERAAARLTLQWVKARRQIVQPG